VNWGGGGQAKNSKRDRRPVQQKTQNKPVRLVAPIGQTNIVAIIQPKMLKPKNPEANKWKVVMAKVRGKKENFKPNFDYLLSKYVNQKASWKNRSSKGIATLCLKQDRSCQSCQTSSMIKIGSMDVIIDEQFNQKTLDH
jgi:hypothetical protein